MNTYKCDNCGHAVNEHFVNYSREPDTGFVYKSGTICRDCNCDNCVYVKKEFMTI